MESAAGQFPYEPGVDRAECEFAILSSPPSVRDIVEQPFDLARAEIGVGLEPGLSLDSFAVNGPCRIADIGGPAILPDDGVVDRYAGCPVPDDGRFALIGDPDRRNIGRRQVGLGKCLDGGFDLRPPDLVRVVLDPTALRIDLRVFFLADRNGIAAVVKNNCTTAGRALV